MILAECCEAFTTNVVRKMKNGTSLASCKSSLVALPPASRWRRSCFGSAMRNRLGLPLDDKKARARRMRQQMTTAERVLWGELRRRQLGVLFHRQQVVRGYIVDFLAPSAKLVVEVDGPIHDATRPRDATRDAAIGLVGLDVLRFANDEVIDDLCSVVARIGARLAVARSGTQRHAAARSGSQRLAAARPPLREQRGI